MAKQYKKLSTNKRVVRNKRKTLKMKGGSGGQTSPRGQPLPSYLTQHTYPRNPHNNAVQQGRDEIAARLATTQQQAAQPRP